VDDVSLQIDCVTDPKNISRSSSDDGWVLIDEIFVVDRGATTRLTDTGTDISRKRQSETLRLPDTDTGTDTSRKRQSGTLRFLTLTLALTLPGRGKARRFAYLTLALALTLPVALTLLH
jgi:hypothetical protein